MENLTIILMRKTCRKKANENIFGWVELNDNSEA